LNYIQLQQQVINRLDNRTDLAQVVYDFSQQRIGYWSKFFFYSSDITDTSITTTRGQPLYNLPNGIFSLRLIRLLIPGNNQAYTTTTAQVTLPVATIPVGSTNGFTTSGTINVGGQIVTYTGITTLSFTGCLGGAGVTVQGTGITQVNPSTTTTAPVTLPVSSIPVVSTAGFQSAGNISVGGTQVVYSSLDATDFLGCVGGAPGLIASGTLVQQLYGIWLSLSKLDYYQILNIDPLAPVLQAQPAWWGQFNTQFRLYPAPNQAYALELTGNQAIPAPTLDLDDNFWTEDGSQLLINATCAEVLENYLHDYQTAQSYRAAEQREYRRLLKTTFNLGDPMIIRSHL
jgi:hypothetical protein